MTHAAISAARERDPSVTLSNWQDAPQNRWAFAHVDELVPTVDVRRGRGDAAAIRTKPAASAALDERVPELAGFLAGSFTDAFMVLQHGEIVDERYLDGFRPEDRHLLMSVSKSLCGLAVGRLVGRGLIDPQQVAGRYVPALVGSAFGDATIQQVLDMTVAVDYNEDYRDPDSHVQAQDRVAGWRPRRGNDAADTYAFLQGLRKSGEHGRVFQYCSAGTDVLAWVVESVTGTRFATALGTELWSKLGCEEDADITVDSGGFAFANGGVSCTLRDLGRVGELMLRGGLVDGRRVIPEAWVTETIRGGDPAAVASGSPFQRVHPKGSYRNQWWVTGNERGNYYAVGIHGQFIWVDPLSDSVIVKFSSWPEPMTEEWNRSHAAAFGTVNAALAVD